MSPALLEAAIVLLALADGLIHLTLVTVIFRFDFSRGGPLPYLFLLNFICYVALAGLFWASRNGPVARRRLVDLVIAGFALVTFVAWWYFTGGRGNPMNLGYTSKVIEVLLFGAALYHWRSLGAARTPAAA
jgi:hypothetical protein